MKRIIPLCVLLLALNFSNFISAKEVIVRPLTWAQPLLSKELDNCFKVSEKLYRCGQPDKKAFKILNQLGIKEVLNLREFHSDKGKTNDLVLHRLKWDTGEVSQTDLVEGLKIIQAAKEPLVVHCWHGADRTGTLVAAYRILFEGWTKQEAIAEMKQGGFGYHSFYDNLIELLKGMDLKTMQKQLGLNP